MKCFKFFVGIIMVVLVAAFPLCLKAGDHHAVAVFSLTHANTCLQRLDTIPAKVTSPETPTNKSTESIIKEVPRSRKQPVPIPVNVKVKPIKIIKPKIIKPVIKIL